MQRVTWSFPSADSLALELHAQVRAHQLAVHLSKNCTADRGAEQRATRSAKPGAVVVCPTQMGAQANTQEGGKQGSPGLPMAERERSASFEQASPLGSRNARELGDGFGCQVKGH